MLVKLTLTYRITGEDPESAVQSLVRSFSSRQGRTESVHGCGANGTYSAECLDKEPQVERIDG